MARVNLPIYGLHVSLPFMPIIGFKQCDLYLVPDTLPKVDLQYKR